VTTSDLDPRAALTVRPYERRDEAWVRAWFRDPELDRWLGPVDDDWCAHVEAETQGVQLVVELQGRPVALVGVEWDPRGDRHAVTDVAVDPSRRRTGTGRTALDAALTWPGHPAATGWVAFVDPENTAALGFFGALGWTAGAVDDGLRCMTSPTGSAHRGLPAVAGPRPRG
jgi:GNAT superfamily N-acetyltransferase